MANPKSLIANPLSSWGTIMSIAQQGLDISTLATAIRSDMETTGQRFGPEGFIPYSQLWSKARSMVNASRSLAAAPGDYAITSNMISVVPYGRTARGEYGMPVYNLRINFTVTAGGVRESRSHVVESINPDMYTVAELKTIGNQYAADFAGGSPINGQTPELEGVDSLYIEQM